MCKSYLKNAFTMKTKLLFTISCCCLFLLFSAMSCDEDDYIPTSTQIDLTGLELSSLNNSGKDPVEITDGRCPKEAYMLRIVPIFDKDDEHYDSYELNTPVTAIRIFTLTDFDADHPAGSDVFTLFRTIYWAVDLSLPLTGFYSLYGYRLVLMTYPQPGNYQFRVEFELEDGTIVSEETEMLEFY